MHCLQELLMSSCKQEYQYSACSGHCKAYSIHGTNSCIVNEKASEKASKDASQGIGGCHDCLPFEFILIQHCFIHVVNRRRYIQGKGTDL